MEWLNRYFRNLKNDGFDTGTETRQRFVLLGSTLGAGELIWFQAAPESKEPEE